MKETLLTTKEVSELLGVHVNTVRSMAEDGRLKGIKTKGNQGHWRFELEEVENFMNDSKEEANSILKEIKFILDDIPSELCNSEENKQLWEYVNKYYGIRSVFGSYTLHSDKATYHNIVKGKGMIWVGEGTANLMEYLKGNGKNSNTLKYKFLNLQTKYAFGVIKSPSNYFATHSYTAIALLVVTDNEGNNWVVDGTLQQFYDLAKGLCVLPLEKANKLYHDLLIYKDKKEFAELYNNPYISEELISKYRGNDKEERHIIIDDI